jgi:hypothetical protein
MDWDFPLITCFLVFIFFVVLLSYYVYNAFVRSLINERWWALVKFPILYLIGLVVLANLSIAIYSFMI